MSGPLSDAHRLMLEIESGISPAVIAARGYRTVDKKTELEACGFGLSQRRVPALLIPVFDPYGEIATYQARPKDPRIGKAGKPLKYETPGGARMAADFPPATRPHIGNPARPLWITEGVKKADAAVSHGLDCIALLGVWNWRGTNDQGGKVILAAFEAVAWNGRTAYIAFDSDLLEKDPVRLALVRFGAVMRQRGATVRVVHLPAGPSGAKVGLDDYLAGGGTIDALVRSAEPLERFEQRTPGGPYFEQDGGLFWRSGPDTEKQMSNFTARIVADVAQDDGAETRRAFEIEASMHGRTSRFTIPAERFPAMSWPVEHLGAAAIIYPGQAVRENARVAIQLLSVPIPDKRVYVHTGWTRRDGERLYLSGSGAIGAVGAVPGVAVNLEGSLNRYALPEPPAGQCLIDAIRASLALLAVAPIEITGPLYAATWRAALGGSDFSIHLAGATGAGKSELAALCQQHYGPAMDARNLPGSWSSTGNALEALAFQAKDALLTVDDFAPGGSSNDVARSHREADRVFRGAGNTAGRARMRADATLRPVKPPRALLFSTGEDVPKGQSLRARLLVLEMAPDAMSWKALDGCQRDARAGLYAAALAGFVQWLAAQGESEFDRFQRLRIEYRKHAEQLAAHKRTPAIAGDLGAAFRLFVDFAIQAGALTAEQGRELWAMVWKALGEAAANQTAYQTQSEPTELFRAYLGGAIRTGRAHLASLSDGEPEHARAYGWRLIGSGEYERMQPQGDRVGWIAGDGLYLDPVAAYAAAQQMAQRSGDSIGVSKGMLTKALKNRRLLLATEPARGVNTVRKRINGRDVSILHTSHSFLDALPPPDSPDKPDNAPEEGADSSDQADIGGFLVGFEPQPDNKTDNENPHEHWANDAVVGFVGFSADKRRSGATDGEALSDRREKPDNKPDNGRAKSDNGRAKPGDLTCKACGSPRTRGLACPACGRTDSEAIAYLKGAGHAA